MINLKSKTKCAVKKIFRAIFDGKAEDFIDFTEEYKKKQEKLKKKQAVKAKIMDFLTESAVVGKIYKAVRK